MTSLCGCELSVVGVAPVHMHFSWCVVIVLWLRGRLGSLTGKVFWMLPSSFQFGQVDCLQ